MGATDFRVKLSLAVAHRDWHSLAVVRKKWFFNFKKSVQSILREQDVGAGMVVSNITRGLDRQVSRIRVNVKIGIHKDRLVSH